MDWQPIETAPKDGTPVKLGLKCSLRVIGSNAIKSYFEDGQWFSEYGESGWRRVPAVFYPTHWMALPPPPSHRQRDADQR